MKCLVVSSFLSFALGHYTLLYQHVICPVKGVQLQQIDCIFVQGFRSFLGYRDCKDRYCNGDDKRQAFDELAEYFAFEHRLCYLLEFI